MWCFRGFQLPPPPHDRLAGTQDHVHRGIRLARTFARDLALGEVERRRPLTVPWRVDQEDSIGVRAFDQVVVAGELHVVGHGLVVAQEVDGVQVPVQEMPRTVVEDLGDAVPEGPGGRRS